MQQEAKLFISPLKDDGFKFFSAFIDHFDNNIDTNDRPVVLLIDSVSSHINKDIFTKADSRVIEMYRLVPNASHFMQLLDKGLFRPLKKLVQNSAKKHS